MSSNENPFKPHDLKRRLLLSVGAGLGFLFVACIGGALSDLNALVTVGVGIVGGGVVAFLVWNRT